MHRILHGIRRSSLWPVASPLAFARLTCPLPFPILNKPSGYGDLPPQSGEEDEEGDLLPQSGDEDEEGDLLPHSGDENGEGILPSQGNEPAVLCDLQPPIKWKLGNNLGILSSKSNGVASAFAAIFHEEHAWSATLCSPGKALQHGHFMKMFAEDEVIRSLPSVALTYVFDPGGLSCLHEEVLSDCQPVSMTSHRHADYAHSTHAGGATMLTKQQHSDTLVHAHIQVGQAKVLQEVLGSLPCVFDGGSNPKSWNVLLNIQCNFAEGDSYQPGFRLDDKSQLAGLSYGKANCRFHENQCKVLLIMEIIQDDVVLYGCSLWLSGRTCRDGAATPFLIPLRGSIISVQWNDEDFAALKMKTKRRMTVLRLLKDLLDPG